MERESRKETKIEEESETKELEFGETYYPIQRATRYRSNIWATASLTSFQANLFGFSQLTILGDRHHRACRDNLVGPLINWTT